MKGFEYYKELVKVLIKAGFTDPIGYPKAHAACELWLRWGSSRELRLLKRRNPGLISEACRRVEQIEWFEEQCPFRPFLDSNEAKRVAGSYLYGVANHDGDFCGFSDYGFPLGIFVCGAQGTGKSHGVFWVIDQILRVPPDVRGFNVIIVQRVKREADTLALKYPWMSVLEWEDLRYNMWEVHDWDTVKEKIRASTKIFAGENFLYSATVPLLRYAVMEAYEALGVLGGSKKFPTFVDIRERIKDYQFQYGFEGYEMKNTFDRLKYRLAEFEMEKEILNLRRGIPFNFFLENDLCLNVVGPSEFVIRTSLMSLLYDIQRYYSKQPSAEGKTRVLLVLDEARWLFDVVRDRSDYPSNEIVESWFTTCRDSGFGRIILTQEPQSISDFVTSNCAFRIAFPVYDKGLERAKVLLGLSEEQMRRLEGLPRPGVCVVRHPGADRSFLVHVPEW